jgi:AraC-like DNA-binding protein
MRARALNTKHLATLTAFQTVAERYVTTPPVSVSELCAAINVPPRTLHDICVAAFGVTARRYLWELRMDHAHKALRRGHPALTSVTEIAMRYGFFELGRFSVAYRKRFSESPSGTLRRLIPTEPCRMLPLDEPSRETELALAA